MTLTLNSTAFQLDKSFIPFPHQPDQEDLRSQLKKYTRSLSAWLQPKTISYSPKGEDTLTYGDQIRWLQVKWLSANALHAHNLGKSIIDADLEQSFQFLTDIAGLLAKPITQTSATYDSFASTFSAMVLAIESVESVVYETQTDTLKLWIVVNNSQENQRYAIYDKQWEAMQSYPQVLIDFVVLDRYDRPLDSIIQWSSGASIISK